MNMEESYIIDFKQERDFSSLLNATFAFLKQEFKPLMKLLLIRLAPFFILIGLFTALSMDNISSNIGSNPFAIFSLYYVGQMLTTLIMFIYLQSLVLHYIKHYNSDSTEPREEYVKNNAMSRVFELFGINLGYGFLAGVATLFLIIPGIYVFVIYSLVYVITILGDGESGVFSKSAELIKDHWWETFGGIVIIFIVHSIISNIFALPSTILFMTDGMTGFSQILQGNVATSDSSLVLNILFSIIAAFGYLSGIIMYIYLSFHYYNLKERKEATGLLDQIDQMEQGLSGDNA